MPMSILTVIVLAALAADAPAPAKTMLELFPKLSPVLEAVEKASDITLLSIDPSEHINERNKVECQGWCYYTWNVLGATRVRAPEEVGAVRNQLLRALHGTDDQSVAMCFNPRHGVRMLYGGHTYDIAACYECGQAEVYVDGDPAPIAGIFFNGDAQAWNSILVSAGVRLAVKPR